MAEIPSTMLQLRSLVDSNGGLTLSIDEVPVPIPADHEVLVRVEAAPINPSDLGMLFAGADAATMTVTAGEFGSVVRGTVPRGSLGALAARLDIPMPVGNEGGGVVVAAGASPSAQALLGSVVGVVGGSSYAQYRCAPAAACIAMPEGITPAQAASPFVNPMTVLCMAETMRAEGHTAIIHTAAASNLGQMLNRMCLSDGIPLVNIVRRPEQADLLTAQGAQYVCDSSSPDFAEQLTAAITATGATLAFDATGGGRLASDILACMEASLIAGATEFNRYGSSTHKQVYIYGGLDRSPTTINRTFGMSWSVGGWLLTYAMQKLGGAGGARLRERVANEITTTFASEYSNEVSLAGALQLEAVQRYAKQATGDKFLIRPHA